MNRQRLLERFLRYVKIDTTARDGAEAYPSSPGQLELGRLLVDELRAMGLADARQDEHGIVLATVPATSQRPGRAIAYLRPSRHLARDHRRRRQAAGDRATTRAATWRCPATPAG